MNPVGTVHPHPSLSARLTGFRYAWAFYEDVRIFPSGPEFQEFFEEEKQRIRNTLAIEEISRLPGVETSRRAFKALGVDPARYRPSQEALLRRIVGDKPISLINSGVDVNNYLSVKFAVPMGLYDVQKISGGIVLKIGEEGEGYDALNGRPLDGRDRLIVRDAQGPFGSPFVDSVRSKVEESTQRLLHLVYFLPGAMGEKDFGLMAGVIKNFLQGSSSGYSVLQ